MVTARTLCTLTRCVAPSAKARCAIAVIDDPLVAERILRHLGAWHDPPARLPPPGATGAYTYEPCDDVAPTPDYENALTD
jgi:hypothetical protein